VHSNGLGPSISDPLKFGHWQRNPTSSALRISHRAIERSSCKRHHCASLRSALQTFGRAPRDSTIIDHQTVSRCRAIGYAFPNFSITDHSTFSR
jgi:hypothetical protein